VRYWPRAPRKPVVGWALPPAVDAEAEAAPPSDAAVPEPDVATAAARPDAAARQLVNGEKMAKLRKPIPVLVAPAATRPLTITVTPARAAAAAIVRLDGKSLGRYAGGPLPIPPGDHILLVSAPAFQDHKVTLAAVGMPASIKVPLKWHPARVVLTCDAPNATVSAGVRGSLKSAIPGAAIPIPVPPESETGEFTVEVRASAAGYRNQSTTVTVRAGGTKTFDFKLVKN
ncbi:MAG TPA: hypothetical protein VGQ83_43225, partial [Polyangia bacterium]